MDYLRKYVSGIAIMIASLSYAQGIYTPFGTEVPNVIFANLYMSEADKTVLRNDYQRRYPNAQYLDEATYDYNCHAYAWHVSEGGQKIWIDRNPVTQYPSVYWEDGSYIQTYESDPAATKVSYHSSDHSAITTGIPGYFISKWGKGCLWRHRYDDCPYNASDLRYYKLNVEIFGNQTVAVPAEADYATVSYHLSEIPQSVSVEWETEGATILEGQNTRDIKVGISHDATIKAKIRNAYGTVTYVPPLEVLAERGPTISDISIFKYGPEKAGEYTVQITTNLPKADFIWSVSGNAQFSALPYPEDAIFQQNPNIFNYVTFKETGSYTISVYGKIGNAIGRVFSKTFQITSLQ